MAKFFTLSASPQLKIILTYLSVALISITIGYSLSHDKKLIMLLLFAIVLFLSLKMSRQIALLVLFWLLIEGYVRRKVAAGTAVIFVKDALLGLVYLKIFLNYFYNLRLRELFQPHPANKFLLLFFLLALIEVFNPNSHYLYGLLGLRVWFFYVPLFFLAPIILGNRENIIRFFFAFGLTVIPICIYALLQIKFNWYANDPMAVITYTPDGQILRKPNATFFYSGNFSTYSHIILIVNVLNAFLAKKPRLKILAFIALAFSLTAVMLSGSRTAWVTSLVIQLPFFLIITKKLNFKDLIKITAAAAILITAILHYSPTTKFYLTSRAQTITVNPYGQVVEERAIPQLISSFTGGLREKVILGHGLGTASTARQHLPKRLIPDLPNYGEGGIYKTLFETGLVGFILFILFLGAIYLKYWQTFQRATDPLDRLILAGTLTILIGFLAWYVKAPIFDEFLPSYLFYFIAGIVFIFINKFKKEEHG